MRCGWKANFPLSIRSVPVPGRPHRAPIPRWRILLRWYRDIAPDVFTFDPECDTEAIHILTAGVKRHVVSLLGIGFAKAFSNGGVVGYSVLENAYKSRGHATFRDDVEALAKLYGPFRNRRKDLWCPIAAVVNPSEDLDWKRQRQTHASRFTIARFQPTLGLVARIVTPLRLDCSNEEPGALANRRSCRLGPRHRSRLLGHHATNADIRPDSSTRRQRGLLETPLGCRERRATSTRNQAGSRLSWPQPVRPVRNSNSALRRAIDVSFNDPTMAW
jgi:hypothetical protein